MKLRAFLPAGVKALLVESLCSAPVGRLVSVLAGDRIRHRGSIISTEDPRIAPAMKAALFWQLYESAEVRFVHRHLPPDLDVLELGGGIGAVACLIRKRLKGRARLVTVEADPELAALVERNLAANADGRSYAVVNRVIDYHNSGQGYARFTASRVHTTGRLAESSSCENNIRLVERTTLRHIVSTYRFESYTLVCDIEGAEAGMTLAGPEELAGCRRIIIELHDTQFQGQKITVEDMIAAVCNQGFCLLERYGPVCAFGR